MGPKDFSADTLNPFRMHQRRRDSILDCIPGTAVFVRVVSLRMKKRGGMECFCRTISSGRGSYSQSSDCVSVITSESQNLKKG
jgi:hypothetical protein